MANGERRIVTIKSARHGKAGQIEYYIHYLGEDRRIDKWINEAEVEDD